MTGSSAVTGDGEREYKRDRADDYAAPPPEGAAISYERPRSPTGSSAGSTLMQSYGGRGRYSRPSDPHDGGICLLHLRGLDVIWIECECL